MYIFSVAQCLTCMSVVNQKLASPKYILYLLSKSDSLSNGISLKKKTNEM